MVLESRKIWFYTHTHTNTVGVFNPSNAFDIYPYDDDDDDGRWFFLANFKFLDFTFVYMCVCMCRILCMWKIFLSLFFPYCVHLNCFLLLLFVDPIKMNQLNDDDHITE